MEPLEEHNLEPCCLDVKGTEKEVKEETGEREDKGRMETEIRDPGGHTLCCLPSTHTPVSQ